MARRIFFSAAIVLLLGACAQTPGRLASVPANHGNTSWHEKVDKDTLHYQLAMGQVASGGSPYQRVDPKYPPSLLPRCPEPVDVDALLIVDTEGKVGEVRVADETQANAERKLFIFATREAAKQWQFNPLTIRYWTADANGEPHETSSETRPFSLGYTFHFECRDGRAITHAAVHPAQG
jgi:hypothetical protein